MSQRERGRPCTEPVKGEFEIVKVTKVIAFYDRFVAREHDAELDFDHALLAQVTDTQHQCRLAIKGRDDKAFAEDDARGRS